VKAEQPELRKRVQRQRNEQLEKAKLDTNTAAAKLSKRCETLAQ
jgi:hypothetical protein